jgi:hypothetical protein
MDQDQSESALLCAGAYCTTAPKWPIEPARLCRPCLAGMAEDLVTLPELYRRCESVLAGDRQSRIRERTSGGSMPGMPFNVAAAEARSAILVTLACWSGLVAEERGITPPARTVAMLAGFLRNHVDWLAAHQTATDASHELARLARAARRMLEPDADRRLTVGDCIEADCSGRLVAHLRAGGGPGTPVEIGCTASPGHRWAAQDWARLERQLSPSDPAETTERWYSPADVSVLRQISTGSVYRLANEHGWCRRKQAGRTYYRACDVEQTFAAG